MNNVSENPHQAVLFKPANRFLELPNGFGQNDVPVYRRTTPIRFKTSKDILNRGIGRRPGEDTDKFDMIYTRPSRINMNMGLGDGGLGKFSLKKVTKAVGNVAKVAALPVTFATASAANAVGARSVANRIVDKTAPVKSANAKKSFMTAARVGGYAGDAAAAVFLAPAVAAGGSSLFSSGGTAFTAAKSFASKLGTGNGITSLFAKGQNVASQIKGVGRQIRGSKGEAITAENIREGITDGSKKVKDAADKARKFREGVKDAAQTAKEAYQTATGGLTPPPTDFAGQPGEGFLQQYGLWIAGGLGATLLFMHFNKGSGYRTRSVRRA